MAVRGGPEKGWNSGAAYHGKDQYLELTGGKSSESVLA